MRISKKNCESEESYSLLIVYTEMIVLLVLAVRRTFHSLLHLERILSRILSLLVIDPGTTSLCKMYRTSRMSAKDLVILFLEG